MKDIVFKSSKRMKIIFIIFYALLIGAMFLVAYFGEMGNYSMLFVWIPIGFILYLNSCETYTLTDKAIVVKRGLSSKKEILWSSITSVWPVGKGFRFDYRTPGGKKGFYVVINIKEVKELHAIVEERVHITVA